MPAGRKTAAFARQLFKLSLDDGRVSAERVAGVLAWVDRHRPAGATGLLRAYKRLIEADINRHRAVIEFAGDVSPEVFQEIADSMSRRFGRDIEPVPAPRPELIAGFRVRVGYDVFENSIASQLAALRSAT